MYYIDNIKHLRKDRKYSQKDMAELLETTQQQYSKYENKQQELPIRHLITICKHFNVSSDWILDLNVNLQFPLPKIIDQSGYQVRGAAGTGKGSLLLEMNEAMENDFIVDDIAASVISRTKEDE